MRYALFSAKALSPVAQGELAAVMSGEVGGGNGVNGLLLAVRLGLPAIHGDLMGRAFPELQVMLL